MTPGSGHQTNLHIKFLFYKSYCSLHLKLFTVKMTGVQNDQIDWEPK